jgi:hypothetical protein
MNLFFDYKMSGPNRIITLDNQHIKEVILGLHMEKEDKKEIISIAKNKGIDVWQTTKGDFEFKIERYKI